jgi:hypothetical protein
MVVLTFDKIFWPTGKSSGPEKASHRQNHLGPKKLLTDKIIWAIKKLLIDKIIRDKK